MFTNLKLAWRNLWRNRRRTLITVASIFFGVLLSTLMSSMQEGTYSSMIDNVVKFYSGYAQIHDEEYWDEKTRAVVNYFKSSTNERGKPYTARYIGALVADFHRNLLYGGIYMYPADRQDPHKPHGKLRLLCEAAPLAFIAEQAGGAATDGKQRILDIKAQELHERVPLFIGCKADVKKATAMMQEE